MILIMFMLRGIVFINNERFPKQDSIWANPFKLKTDQNCIEKYKDYIVKKLENPLLLEELKLLKGKNLGCWCHPNPCHANVLIELIKHYNL